MDATEFMRNLKEKKALEPRELSAREFFESDQGKRMMEYIRDNVKIIDEVCFTVDEWQLKRIQENPLYKGRSFFFDMGELGFIRKIISYHQGELPIKTYQFQA